MDAPELQHTDEELVGLSLTEPRYFAVLVDRFEAQLTRYVARLGRFGKEDIEDILQNTFLKLYENLNGFDSSLKFSSWVYRIAHNEAISYFRRSNVRPEGHLVPVSEDVIDNVLADTNIELEVTKEETSAALREAVERLPQHYREVVVLRYFEYKEYDEISDILELPPGTVATRLRRGKEALKAAMKQYQ